MSEFVNSWIGFGEGKGVYRRVGNTLQVRWSDEPPEFLKLVDGTKRTHVCWDGEIFWCAEVVGWENKTIVVAQRFSEKVVKKDNKLFWIPCLIAVSFLVSLGLQSIGFWDLFTEALRPDSVLQLLLWLAPVVVILGRLIYLETR